VDANKQKLFSMDADVFYCPKCLAEIRWVCHGKSGYAYCANSVGATRIFEVGKVDKMIFCNWEGKTFRRPDGKVEIYY
tara:strand:+ start:259 stop:492 length:234 start_codon:yes stop_codon:yes gene_type:complete